MNGLLKKADIESTDINKALNAVKASSNAMPQIKHFLKHFTKSMEVFDDDQIFDKLNWKAVNSGQLKNISCEYSLLLC